MNDIKCPNCGKIVHIDEALKHQLEKTILKEYREKQEIEIEKVKQEVELKAKTRFEKEREIELLKSQKEKELLEQKLLKEQREREGFEKKIKEEALKTAEHEQRLKLKEKDLQLEEIRKVNEDLKRKLEQGSQQRQGEVLELDLEQKLKEAFPSDEFLPIPKGVEGADILHKVKLQGQITGSIIWETKRTKQWSKLWLTKLKEDAAKVSATEAIIVTQVLPDDSVSFDRKENVWITNYEQAISIAKYVRFLINAIYKMKSSTSQTNEDWTKVRDYMLSDSFKHRMQAHFDAVKNLREMLDTEKRTSTLRWVRQQKQIDKLDSNTVNFYAELKDIVHSLPELEEIETSLIETDSNENEQDSII